MEELTRQLLEVVRLAEVNIEERQIRIIDRGCPHTAVGELPTGKMGIYLFEHKDGFLKIGMVGPKSKARFSSQHYNPDSSQSNLAKSILNDPDMGRYDLTKSSIKGWIEQNIRRIDIIIDSSLGIFVLRLIESFLQCKYKPKYEGFNSQKK